MNDCYVGTDAQRDMRMRVDAPEDEAESDVEDDISEPDEDSLAGQMALMKGQNVRRSAVHGEDSEEESGSGEDDSEDESSGSEVTTDDETSSSDSDSD